MPTARELLEQADALMRRNRAGAVETRSPEHAEVAPAAGAPPAPPTDLDDVPELTDAVEEIEIASMVELPDEGKVVSESPHVDHDVLLDHEARPAETSAVGAPARSEEPTPAAGEVPAPMEPVSATEAPVAEHGEPPTEEIAEPVATEVESAAALADVPPMYEAAPAVNVAESAVPLAADALAADATAADATAADAATATAAAGGGEAAGAVPEDEWARWQALAEEIRMQVLQRIDIFTDTALREQLASQLQPIVDRASAEMIATINQQVGVLLRAYIAEAIEREIEKWRGGNA